MGMERLVADLADLAVLLRLLARSGTGQQPDVYTTLLTGPRRTGEEDGPEELHVVILDNGRSNLLGTHYQEMLACIRCGACLNVCPVYRKTGGAAYGPVYSGPMGAVLLPLLVGLERGAVAAARVVALRRVQRCLPGEDPAARAPARAAERSRRARASRRGGSGSRSTLWSLAWSSPLGYRLTTRARRGWAQPLGGLAGPGRTWAKGRALPRLGRRYRDGR